MGGGLLEDGFEGGEGGLGDGFLVGEIVEGGREVFAEGDGLGEDPGAEVFGRYFEAAEFSGLRGGDEFGLPGEAEEFFVGAQELFATGGIEAVVEGIDEVEGGVSGYELERPGGSGCHDH